jgi:uncharacterized membrane protein YeaQ/YmgE (transglycosylase-associated protein family)
MGILAWIVFGLVVGLIARAIMPGRQSMGLVMTAVLGVVGSLVGGFIATLLTGRQMGDLHGAGLIGSILGALAVMFIAGGAFSRRRALP